MCVSCSGLRPSLLARESRLIGAERASGTPPTGEPVLDGEQVAGLKRYIAEARQSGSTWRIGDAVEARVELTGEMRSMLDRCDAERRELTASERRDYSRLEGDLDRINADIREHEAGQRRGDGAPPDIAAEGAPIRSSASILGERGEILAPEQRVADWVRSRPQSFGERPGDDIDPEESRSFSLGRAVRGMVSGPVSYT